MGDTPTPPAGAAPPAPLLRARCRARGWWTSGRRARIRVLPGRCAWPLRLVPRRSSSLRPAPHLMRISAAAGRGPAAPLLARIACLVSAAPAGADDDHRRTDDAVAEAVPLLHDRDDLVLLARRLADRLVHRRVERLPIGRDLFYPRHVEHRLELALDQADAIGPGESGEVRVDVAQRPVEVVREREQVDDQGGVREPRALAPFLLDAPLEVLVVGGGALPVLQVSLRFFALLLELGAQRVRVVRGRGIRGA